MFMGPYTQFGVTPFDQYGIFQAHAKKKIYVVGNLRTDAEKGSLSRPVCRGKLCT